MNTPAPHQWLNDPASAGMPLEPGETELARDLLALAEGTHPSQGFVTTLAKELSSSTPPAPAHSLPWRNFLRYLYAGGALAALAVVMMFLVRLLPGTQPAAPASETPTILITDTPVPAENYLPIENALAQAILGGPGHCEWDTLGNDASTGQQYVWALCETAPGGTAGSMPAVIHWDGGQISAVSLPQDGTEYGPSIRRLFPVILHERIFDYTLGEDMIENLRLRWEDASLLPLAVRPHASSTPAAPSSGLLNEQSPLSEVLDRLFAPRWQTLWVRLENRIYQPDGHYTTTLEEAWLDRDGGRLLRSDEQSDVDMPTWTGTSPRWAWASNGLGVRQLDRKTGEETYTTQADHPWGEHPLEEVQPMLFSARLAIKSSVPGIVRADTWIGRPALVVTWDGHLYWMDAQSGLILRDVVMDVDDHIASETRVAAILFNPELPHALAEPASLKNAGFGGIPEAGGFDAATSPLEFEFTPSGDTFTEGVTVTMDVYAQGYYLGSVETGALPGGSCDRSADGSKLAFQYEGIVDNVVVTNTLRWVEVNDLSTIHNDFPELHLRSAVAWAPQGDRLAFQAMHSDRTQAGLYILDVASNQLQYIPYEQVSLWQPVWKPDGTQIAFVGSDGGAAFTLNIVDAGSGALLHTAGFDFPTWSPTEETPFTAWGVDLPQEEVPYARCLFPKAPVSVPAGMVQYQVQPGDTAASIAQQFGVTVEALHQANNLSEENVLTVGQTLWIPVSDGPLSTPAPSDETFPYVVAEGDTIALIASSFGLTPQELLAANGLPAEGAQIYVGQVLKIPISRQPTPTPP